MLNKYCGLIFLLLWATGTSAAVQPSVAELKQVEQQLEQEKKAQEESQRKAVVLSREVKEVQQDLVSTAQKIQSQEGKLSELEKQKKNYERQEKELLEKLALSDKQLYRVMKGLQTLALRPSALLYVQKKLPIQILRSKMLMRYSLPVIGQLSEETRQNLIDLAQMRENIGTKMGQIRRAHSDLSDQNKKMNRLLQQKKIMQAQYTSDYEKSKQKAKVLADKAKDLKDLLKKLEEQKLRQQKTQPIRPMGTGTFAKARGHLSWPAKGVLIQKFGDKSVSGAHTKGVVLRTRPMARLITPFDGVVLFAGPFQNYGQLLIIDHGNEYMTVLAGMETIHVSVGQELLAGEPIAGMGQDYVNLYLEIRHSGQAIDPEPWYRQGEIK